MVKSLGFRYVKEDDRHLMRILSIGMESSHDEGYSWEGSKREGGGFIFQFTLSGEGRLRVGPQVLSIPAGQAFLVKVPSDHCYYYESATAIPWEFIWLRFDGPGVEELCFSIMNRTGPVLSLQRSAGPIMLLERLYEDLLQERLAEDKYLISLRMYEWMMSLLRVSVQGVDENGHIPDTFRKAVGYMDQYYAESIQLSEVAAFAGLSKHHLCRMFPKYYGFTPIHYLRRKRIQESLKLLRDTGLPAQEIALRTGFDNLGYFGKVFRALMGMTPTEFRGKRNDLNVDSIKLLG
ncbi:AraC family transcriptional regulator [Paenibacillus sp. FSL H7-0331]|uniref:helix-turn-helix domain-containing protein n=2 Tax=Paenibacillus sp. FSL H7-0331 TaxID=1920421 RepID=UPI0009F9FD44